MLSAPKLLMGPGSLEKRRRVLVGLSVHVCVVYVFICV